MFYATVPFSESPTAQQFLLNCTLQAWKLRSRLEVPSELQIGTGGLCSGSPPPHPVGPGSMACGRPRVGIDRDRFLG